MNIVPNPLFAMEDTTMRQEVQALMSKYGNANLVKEIKHLNGGDSSKKSKMEANLDKLLKEYGTISLARFKKEAAKAWHRAFPEGLEKREVKGYQLFVKENMPRVKSENPGASHSDRMAIIGKMWQDTKGTAPPPPQPVPIDAHVPEPAIESMEEETETDPEPEPKRRMTRSRRQG
jgi:hypothetical protein